MLATGAGRELTAKTPKDNAATDHALRIEADGEFKLLSITFGAPPALADSYETFIDREVRAKLFRSTCPR